VRKLGRFFRLLIAARLPGDEVPMNVQLPVHVDKRGFLAWVQGREGRYELAGGRVVMMVGASRAHGILVMNLASIMRAQLDAREWTVIADFGLDLGPETLRYPDIVVDPAGGSADDYTATAPALIAEVLSPSTADVDLGDKAAEYRQLPSLSAYLVFAQREPKAWVWVRGSDGFPPAPNVIVGYDKVIHIAALRLVMPLGAVYAGIEAG
jgi:Uma2 family endonuclease